MRRFLRRGWWKPWNWSTKTWIMSICVSVFLCPLVSRWIFLWQVPDVTLPFDVEDVIQAEVPRDEDAFVRYTTSMQFARRHLVNWSNDAITEAMNFDDKWDPRLDQWLTENRLALEHFRAAGELRQAGGPSLRTADHSTTISLHADFSYLAKLSVAEGMRLERADDLEAAWLNHRANLRCAHHAEKPGFSLCCLFANAVRGFAFEGIRRWAEHPGLTPERLRSARQELDIHLGQRMPITDVGKADYLALRNTLNSLEAPNILFPQLSSGGPDVPLLSVGKGLVVRLVGQPELTLRLARQLLLNNHQQLTTPLHQRRKEVGTPDSMFSPLIFELDSETRRQWGQLEPSELDASVKGIIPRPLFLDRWLSQIRHTDLSRSCDDARFATLNVVLASQEYQRTHGEFPRSLQDLVPKYLTEIPVDPLDEQGAPLRYRRDENGDAVVWSIGRNKIDDQGHLESKDGENEDLGFRLRVNPGPGLNKRQE